MLVQLASTVPIQLLNQSADLYWLLGQYGGVLKLCKSQDKL